MGVSVGGIVGLSDGLNVGFSDMNVGIEVNEAPILGERVGLAVGNRVGLSVRLFDGNNVGYCLEDVG